MEAIRETLDVTGNSITICLPTTFAARRVDVIVLPALEQDGMDGPGQLRHQPASELAGTVIHDDLVSTADGAEDWDALR